MACVPLAPGVVKTGMTGGDFPGAAAWAKDAVPLLLGLGRGDNGRSMHVPGFYSEEYMASWIIRPDQDLVPVAMNFDENRGLGE
jgi:hypothetical protein